jgi:hypothetical protein
MPKVIPLCLRIGACLRRLATGEPYSSLETSFQISKTVLVDFCHKFLQWFLKNYYTMYVGGLSGVGFDTKAEIEQSESVFLLWNRLATPQDTHDQESNAPSAPLAKCTRFGCARD